MLNLLKVGFVGLYMGLVSYISVPVSQLLKQADSLYAKKPAKAIQMAEQAYHQSVAEKDHKEEIRSLNILSDYYWQAGNYLKSRQYASAALGAGKKYRIDSLQGDSYVLLGMLDYDQSGYTSAISNYQNALNCYSNKVSPARLATVYLDMGMSERRLARFQLANYYQFKAATIFQQLHDLDGLADTYLVIGNCFNSLNEYDKAISYYRKALSVGNNTKDIPLMFHTYNSLGYTFKLAQKPDSAMVYLLESLKLGHKEKDSSGLVLPLQNLGSVMKMKGQVEVAARYLQRSLVIANKYQLKLEYAEGELDMAELHMARKNYAEALNAANAAGKFALMEHVPELAMRVAEFKATLFAKTGNYQQAFACQAQRDRIKDSLFTVSKNAAITELDIKYQTRQKEQDILNLNRTNSLQQKAVRQQRLSIALLLAGVLLLVVLLIVVYRSFKLKHQANLRIQTLMRELHHRVKNNLQILSGLFAMQLEEFKDEGTRNALRENETRLASMNLIHNQLYLDSEATTIDMGDYLTKLVNHVKNAFGNEETDLVNLNIAVDPMKLDADKAVAIGLIVNELITNSFKYAFDGAAGKIDLSLKFKTTRTVVLIVADNGKGIKQTSSEKSFGLKLVRLLARQLGSTLVVENGRGTAYQIEITL